MDEELGQLLGGALAGGQVGAEVAVGRMERQAQELLVNVASIGMRVGAIRAEHEHSSRREHEDALQREAVVEPRFAEDSARAPRLWYRTRLDLLSGPPPPCRQRLRSRG